MTEKPFEVARALISDGYVVKTASVLGYDLTFPTEKDARYVATAMNKMFAFGKAVLTEDFGQTSSGAIVNDRVIAKKDPDHDSPFSQGARWARNIYERLIDSNELVNNKNT